MVEVLFLIAILLISIDYSWIFIGMDEGRIKNVLAPIKKQRWKKF